MKKMNILLVEDDELLCKSIIRLLGKNYNFKCCKSYNEAIDLISEKRFDLFLIDIILQENNIHNGISLIKYIRERGLNQPIIMITAKKSINFKLGAFKYGADDYICKPFNVLELNARIKAVLNRSRKVIIKINDLEIDLESRKVKVKDKYIELRKKEFDILYLLASNRKKVITREKLVNNFWPSHKGVSNNTIDVHIKNIRSKLKKVSKVEIKTVYGVGFIIE